MYRYTIYIIEIITPYIKTGLFIVLYSLSMPAIVGKDGVETHVPIQLNKEETEKLQQSAKTLQDIIKQNEF